MAYTLVCDIERCGAEIERGPGQPTLPARRHIYCQRCERLVAGVEAQLRREATDKAREGKAWYDARRDELMGAMLPPQLGGTGKGQTEWPKVG